jgi:amidase
MTGAVPAPSRDALERLASDTGIELRPAELDAFAELAARYIPAYERLLELGDEHPRQPQRLLASHRPPAHENRNGGWILRCTLRTHSDGQLAGKRIAVKDNLCVGRLPMLVGSPLMEGFTPSSDATVVERILEAGGEIIGKTAVPGFCMDGACVTGYPDPQPVNPHSPTRSAGGSSGGNAVVLIDGDADLAVGSDTAGSIRLPAAWSGVVGLKPTYDIVPTAGLFPIEPTLDHVGPMARTVDECALLLDTIADHSPPAGRRANTPERIDPAELDLAQHFDVGLAPVGGGPIRPSGSIQLSSTWPASASASSGKDSRSPVAPNRTSTQLSPTRHERSPNSAPSSTRSPCRNTSTASRSGRQSSSRAPSGCSSTAASPSHAGGTSPTSTPSSEIACASKAVDVLVLPTTPMKALPLPEPGDVMDVFATAWSNLQNTAAFNVTGHPALSIPCQPGGELPIGAMLVAQHHDDHVALRVGAALEAAVQ